MADKSSSFGQRLFDIAIPAVCLAGVVIIVLAVASWVAAMAISSIDCEFDPTSKRCQIVEAQDVEAARKFWGGDPR